MKRLIDHAGKASIMVAMQDIAKSTIATVHLSNLWGAPENVTRQCDDMIKRLTEVKETVILFATDREDKR